MVCKEWFDDDETEDHMFFVQEKGNNVGDNLKLNYYEHSLKIIWHLILLDKLQKSYLGVKLLKIKIYNLIGLG